MQIQLYVAGRPVKVVPRYALGFHLDPPPGSGSFAFRIWRVENCLRQEWPAAPDAKTWMVRLAPRLTEASLGCVVTTGRAKAAPEVPSQMRITAMLLCIRVFMS